MIQGSAPGRCGLVGNPSDMYGGSVLSLSTRERAHCTLTEAAQMQITVDGRASVPVQVLLAPSAPAIFTGAILNQDYSQNKPSNPAMVGSVIQIFLTGLPAAGVTGVTGKIHDRDNLTPYYAGPAPGFIGVQQVNLVVPADLPATTTEVKVCAAGVCTSPATLTLKQ